MDSKIMDVLSDRVLELGPKPAASGPYRNFKLTRDADGVAWLLFDRADASANTLSSEVIEEFDSDPDGARKPAARRHRDPLGEDIRLHRRRRYQRVPGRLRSERGRNDDRPRASASSTGWRR